MNILLLPFVVFAVLGFLVMLDDNWLDKRRMI